MNIRYLREPGYVFDLFFLFVLQFNREYCLEEFVNRDKVSEDTAFYNDIISEFGPVPEELYPFFWMKDNSKTFVSSYCFDAHRDEFISSFSFDTVQKSLSDYRWVQISMLQFYFPELDESARKACLDSFERVSRVIDSSRYSDRVKCRLYRFFLEPVEVIHRLTLELTKMEAKLARYYEKRSQCVVELATSLDIEKLSAGLKQISTRQVNLDGFEKIYISGCLINRTCIKFSLCAGDAVILLGTEYNDYIETLIKADSKFRLDAFGCALSEANRVDILNLMHERDEITIKDIEQSMKISGTNAYYHLTLMSKAGIIKTRNIRRTIYYSIDKHNFSEICAVLAKYYEKE